MMIMRRIMTFLAGLQDEQEEVNTIKAPLCLATPSVCYITLSLLEMYL